MTNWVTGKQNGEARQEFDRLTVASLTYSCAAAAGALAASDARGVLLRFVFG